MLHIEMDTAKPDYNKPKVRGKFACSSNLSTKFIEKEGLNGISLSFSNLPSSLCDFIPKDHDSLSHEIDFDIAKQLKKLEKKDPLTKQKSLTDLLEMFAGKDGSSIISTLKFWPKLYNRLSLDDDKKVRELTQQLMRRYSIVCGKEISPFIKQLLPTWIISQSDLHIAAANIAKQSFMETFPDQIKQEKAYLLCWRSIYEIICANLSKAPLEITEGNVNYSSKEETYIQDIVINIRTMITLIPYLKNSDEATKDLTTLLKSKHFWSHHKVNVILIQSIYIQLGCELLDYFSEFLLSSTFVASNICECFRMINTYHAHLISTIWTSIVKCCDKLGNIVWKFVSFKTAFMPKFIELFECAADGNISHIYSRMLPFFCHLPIAIDSTESNIIFEQIFIAMEKGSECTRVVHNELESNCMMRMIFECATYVMIVAGTKGNTDLMNAVLQRVLHLTEKYFSEPRLHKTTKAVADFASSVVRPLIKKRTIPVSVLTDAITTWIDRHHKSAAFCENLTSLLLQFDGISDDQIMEFRTSLMKSIGTILHLKIIDRHEQCLIPYFYTCSTSVGDISTFPDGVLDMCPNLMRQYSPSVTGIISRGLATILANGGAVDAASKFADFLDSLSPAQSTVFFTRFYRDVLLHVDVCSSSDVTLAISRTAFHNWANGIQRSIEQIIITDSRDDSRMSIVSIIELCRSIGDRHGLADVALLFVRASDTVESNIGRSMSTDSVDRLVTLMQQMIEEELMHGHSREIASLPPLFVRNLQKLLLCSVNDTGDNNVAAPFFRYLRSDHCSRQLSMELIDEAISSTADATAFAGAVIEAILQQNDGLVDYVESILHQNLVSIEQAVTRQYRTRYSPIVAPSQLDLVIAAVHKIIVLQPIERLRDAVIRAAVLIDPVVARAFASCHNSNGILNRCESVHKLVVFALHDRSTFGFCDRLLASATNGDSGDEILDQCSSLVLLALQRAISDNYSCWSSNVRSAVDMAVAIATQADCVSTRQLQLVTRVLLPCAIKARYLVQETVLAALTEFISCPSITRINHTLLIIVSLCNAEPAYFPHCFELLHNVRSTFDAHLDKLMPASIIADDVDNGNSFCLTSLLEFVAVGVDYSTNYSLAPSLNSTQWEFILCLIDTLVRSDQFADVSNYRSSTTDDLHDPLLNAFLLARIISLATVSLASVKISSIIDEWDNLFSPAIFTALLDQFSLIAGDGKLICSDSFSIFTEALCDAVALCPVAVLIGHNLPGSVHLNDPLDLPRDFLAAFNFLLQSLSNSALSVQLAAFNCLQNCTEMLADLLLEQVNASERNESLEIAFSINLPHRLVEYIMAVDDLHRLNLDNDNNQVVLVRGLLAWQIVLQLFTGAQPKLRAEIGAFLSGNDRCFDRFLNFCFTFMPKNPIVNKKHLSFISDAENLSVGSAVATGSHSCNLIAEEPHIFSQCIERRSKFIIYHLSAYMFRRSMQVLPNLCRGWYQSLDTQSQQFVDSYVRQFLTKELFKIEFKLLREIADQQCDEKLEIKAVPLIGEVTVKYHVSCDQSLEQLIRLPNNYPIGNISVEYRKEMTVKIPHWKSWVGQMTMTLENQNGSIFDGIKLWKRNLDNYFNGIEDCMICYSIIHPSKYTLPSMPCYQCKKKFHKECMYKWFHSSTNPTCPNCRNVFYDGSQKSNK